MFLPLRNDLCVTGEQPISLKTNGKILKKFLDMPRYISVLLFPSSYITESENEKLKCMPAVLCILSPYLFLKPSL